MRKAMSRLLGDIPGFSTDLTDGPGLDNSPASHVFQMSRSCHWNCGMRIRPRDGAFNDATLTWECKSDRRPLPRSAIPPARRI
jgi:hypothetical protein